MDFSLAQLHRMRDGYLCLFLIENNLRRLGAYILEMNFGANWQHNTRKKYKMKILSKNLFEMEFYELIIIINLPEMKGYFSDQLILDLKKLLNTRNKLAHSRLIDEKELELLKNVCLKIKKTKEAWTV